MSPALRNRSIGFVLAGAIFALDQWLKSWVVNAWGLVNEGQQVVLTSFFNFTRVHNRGVSLGMFTAGSPEMRWALVAVTAVIALVVFVWMMRERKLFDVAALGMILGGALGNIRDRQVNGYVLDFADFHIGEFRPFLVINLADACITVGVLIILARALFMREKPPAAQGEQLADPTAENSTK